MKSQDKKRKLARHTDSLTFEELLSCSKRLLSPEGKFCVIIPSNLKNLFCDKALIEGFFITKQTAVIPKADIKPLRVFAAIGKHKKTIYLRLHYHS